MFVSTIRACRRNAEEMEKLNCQIGEQRSRQLKADTEKRRVEDLLQEITMTLWNVCNKFRVSNFLDLFVFRSFKTKLSRCI